MVLAKAKLLRKGINDAIIFSHCRQSKVPKMKNIRSEAALNVRVPDVLNESLAFFGMRQLLER